MRSALRRLLQERAYNVVVLSGRPSYRAIGDLRLPPIVADMCDATTMRLQGQRQFVGRLGVRCCGPIASRSAARNAPFSVARLIRCLPRFAIGTRL